MWVGKVTSGTLTNSSSTKRGLRASARSVSCWNGEWAGRITSGGSRRRESSATIINRGTISVIQWKNAPLLPPTRTTFSSMLVIVASGPAENRRHLSRRRFAVRAMLFLPIVLPPRTRPSAMTQRCRPAKTAFGTVTMCDFHTE
jgi:hypothetical protein